MHGEKIHAYGMRILKGFRPNGPLAVALPSQSDEYGGGAVVAQWITPQTLNHEVPGSNLLAVTVSALGQCTLSSLPSPS